jgi:hypothetical protein
LALDHAVRRAAFARIVQAIDQVADDGFEGLLLWVDLDRSLFCPAR